MKVHLLDLPEVFQRVQSGPDGLTPEEAARRLSEYGPNEVHRVPGEPPILRLLKAFANFFAVILWLAALLAFLADHARPGEGMGTLGAAIVCVILINGVFSFWQESKAGRALAELEKLLPRRVTVVRGGVPRPIDGRELVPGDVFLIEEGDEVPADARIIEAQGLALAMASQRMARRNVLIRHLPSVEALGSASVICTDKTGTLTENRMSVVRVFESGGFVEAAALTSANRPLILGMASCHSLRKVDGDEGLHLGGDPMEIALVETARRALGAEAPPRQLGDIPFDTDRRRLAVLTQEGTARILHVKGSFETVVPLCARFQDGGTTRPLEPEDVRRVTAAQDAMAEAGLRVLAFAYRDIDLASPVDPESPEALADLERDLVLTGLVAMRDPPRPEVPAAVQRCRAAGIRVIMITGDHPVTAVAIAREIGLVTSDAPSVVTGDHLAHMLDTELQIALDAPEIVFARTRPDQKMRIVLALQRKRHVVAVTGDGVNDAPALKAADVGIAMGKSGTDVARSAADIVLADDDFASIVAGIEEGRAVFANIRKFLTYILTSNIPELVPYLAFVLFRIPLPLTIVQILAVDLGTDMLPALALGAEAPDPRLMERPPRRPGERLLDARLLLRAYGFLGLLEAAAALAAYFFVLHAGGYQLGQTDPISPALYREATTACFTAIVLSQMANLFICRSETDSTFRRGVAPNRWLLGGIASEVAIVLFIDYTAWGNLLFGTAPLRASAWAFAVPFVLGMLLLEEARKAWARRA